VVGGGGRRQRGGPDGVAGLQVVRMLEATDESLRKKGGMVYL